jgi:hypothetical protein
MEECLNNILIEGDFKEFENDWKMHYMASLWEMFEGYFSMSGNFLAKETEMLDEAKGIRSHPVIKNLL